MACSCQSLNVSPAELGGSGEAKAPAGSVSCPLELTLPSVAG